TCPPSADSPGVVAPPPSRSVVSDKLRSIARHFSEAVCYVVSSTGFFLALVWMLITRRLDGNVSGWSVLGNLAKRGLKIYKLPVKVLRALQRRARAQGSTV